VRRPKHELVRALVVEVDEARIGLERLGDLAGDEREHLLEVERRVDGRDRLGQQPEVTGSRVHAVDSRAAPSGALYKLLTAAAGETSNDRNRFSDR
jgi:hypothetical protein